MFENKKRAPLKRFLGLGGFFVMLTFTESLQLNEYLQKCWEL